MADEPSEMTNEDIELVGAYDERKRLFDRLRDLRIDDDTRTEVRKGYAAAAKRFDELRAKLVE